MNYSSKQQELDVSKWYDSENSGYDKCGSYSYCAYCNKSFATPCAKAFESFSGYKTSTATRTIKTAKKPATAKKATKARSTKSTAKKATAKA